MESKDYSTPLTRALGFSAPIIVAPMGGGPTTPELVAASCNAGALGTVAAAYLRPDQIERDIAKTRTLTDRPFAVNLFTPMPRVDLSPAEIEAAVAATRPYRQELGLPDPVIAPPYHPDFEEQFATILRLKPRVFSFVFGLIEPRHIEQCKRQGIYAIGTATTRDEALQLERAGVDAIIVQGVEAGAHRGIFSPTADDPGIGTLELTRAVSATVRVPVIAAGGLMNGQEIANVLKAGAQAAVLGTAFLLCKEAGTSKPYRRALAEQKNTPTQLTRAFSGRFARGIENRFMREQTRALPFPVQNTLTRDIRNRATELDRPEYLSLWAGTGFANIREMPAADLIAHLIAELRSCP